MSKRKSISMVITEKKERNLSGASSYSGVYNMFMDTIKTLEKYVSIPELEGKLTKIPFPSFINAPFIENPCTISIATFNRMRRVDPIIGACLEYNNNCIIATIGDYHHENIKIQKSVRQFIKLLNIKQVAREMLSAIWAGFCVGEKEYSYHPYFKFKYINRVTFSPPELIKFMVDERGYLLEDTGILQMQITAGGQYNTGMNSGWMSGFQSIDSSAGLGSWGFPLRYPWPQNYIGLQAVPRKKCVHWAFTHGGSIVQPYGESCLERIYGEFNAKSLASRLQLQHLLRCVAPSMLAFIKDSNAVTQTDHDSYIQHVADSLANMGETSSLAIPGWTEGETANIKVQPIDVAGRNSDAFIAAIQQFNQAMQRGLFIPETLFGTGQTGASYALGTSQGSTHYQLTLGTREALIEVITQDIIRDFIEMNFSEDEHCYDWGTFEERLMTLDEKLQAIKVWETAVNSGGADPKNLEHQQWIVQKLGLPEIIKLFTPYQEVLAEQQLKAEPQQTNQRDGKQVYTNHNNIKG